MPHQGRSVQDLWGSGVREVSTLQHAALDEGGITDFIEGLSPESRQEAIDLIGGPTGGDGGDNDFVNTLLDCLGSGKTRAECLEESGISEPSEPSGPAGPAGSITQTGTGARTGETEIDSTRTTTTQSLELIKQISREYIDVPTAEEFLDNFETAFSGFAANAAEAGMSSADIDTLLDPRSGFMQSMLQEYMGNLAQRAQAGEDIFEVVGVGGQEERLGTRTGDITETAIGRMTRTEAEQILTERGEEITSESIQSTIDEDFQTRQETMATTTEETTTSTQEEITGETGTTRFEETEELFSRPRVTPVFRFSPTEFLLTRFASGTEGTPEEVKERFIGALTTQLRASSPRQVNRGGTVAIAARRT